MTQEIAVKDLLIEEIRASKQNRDDIFEFFMSKNLAKEAIIYLQKLWEHTVEISGNIVFIGKIIVMKIIDFIKENPNMVFGMALGAITGALASIFVSWIPVIGQALSILGIAGGILIGAIAGNRMDRAAKGEYVDNGLFAVFGDTISVAKKFLKLFYEIIDTLRKNS